MNDLITVDKLKDEQEDYMRAIVETKGANLPDRIDQVLSIFEYTSLKAKAWKLYADTLSRLEDQTELYNSALRSGQQWGISALYAQKRMGEITREMPKKVNQHDASPGAGKAKGDVLEEKKMNFRHAADAERIANNPEILDRVIENAKAKGEIPTKTAVLNTIKVEAAKERHEVQRKKYEDSVDNQRDRAVADYYEAIKGFKAAIEFARIAAERGKFAPEGKNLLVKKHNELRDMMNTLEGLL